MIPNYKIYTVDNLTGLSPPIDLKQAYINAIWRQTNNATSNIVVQVLGSFDGEDWYTLDSSVELGNETRYITNKPMKLIRFNVISNENAKANVRIMVNFINNVEITYSQPLIQDVRYNPGTKRLEYFDTNTDSWKSVDSETINYLPVDDNVNVNSIWTSTKIKSEIDNLQNQINNRTEIGHQHEISDINNLEQELDAILNVFTDDINDTNKIYRDGNKFYVYDDVNDKYNRIHVTPVNFDLDFDNNTGGGWNQYMRITVHTPATYTMYYKIEINGNILKIYSNKLRSVIMTSSIVGSNFWQLSNGIDIRVFDEYTEQQHFWVEKFDTTNQKALIWVKVEPGQQEINIAYGNPQCTTSNYDTVTQFFNYTVSNLIGCWKFDEGSGTSVVDESVYGRGGNIVNDVLWTTYGYYGPALEFTNGYVAINSSTSMSGYSQLSIICRIKPHQSNAGQIINKEYCYMLSVANSKIHWAINNNSQWDFVSTGLTVLPNEWYTVCLVYENANSIKTYVYDDSGACNTHVGAYGSGNISQSTSHLRIGNRSWSNSPFKGIIDEVIMFDKALSDVEIQRIVSSYSVGDDTGNLLAGPVFVNTDLQFGNVDIVNI